MSPAADTVAFIRLAFAAQPPLAWMQAQLESIEDGSVSLSFPVRDDLCTVGTGVVMGGLIALAGDVAAGLSLLTRLEPPRPILTTSITAHQIAPAMGGRIVCVGSIVKVGRTQGLARAEVFSDDGPNRRAVSTLIAGFAIP